MRLDHLIYAVADLESGVRRFADEYGLASVDGGEHPEFGTHNAIVPVGPGQFIELMAIADEDSQHPLVLSLSTWLRDGDHLVAVCLRPDDLDEVAERLSIPVVPAERHRPTGDVLRWRLAGIPAALGPERLPFFIDWQGAEQQLDRQHAHAASTQGIAWVEYGGDASRLTQWIGKHELPLRVLQGDPGPRAVGLQRGSETVVIK
ncbi:MAG TPA: VOC family protein [Solirubrobacteraceae bacterium]|nr:VOC family protein [Solirubrobacteraceae bacterium]